MKLKFDIKKYLALGVVVAGSSLMVSCDGEDGAAGADGARGATGLTGAAGADGTNGTNGADGARGATGLTGAQGAPGNDGSNGAVGPTGPQGPQGIQGPPGTSPVPAALADYLNNDAALQNQLSVGANSFDLIFDADPSNTAITTANLDNDINGLDGLGGPTGASKFELGDSWDLSLNTPTFSNVSGSGSTITIGTIADNTPAPGDAEFRNLVLTETNFSIVGQFAVSSGTFAMDVEIPAFAGIPVPAAAVVAANGAVAPATFTFAGSSAPLESVATKQPTITVGADVFTAPVGTIIFVFGGNYYVTNASAPASGITSTTPTFDIVGGTTSLTVGSGQIFCLTTGSRTQATAPQTGTYIVQTRLP